MFNQNQYHALWGLACTLCLFGGMVIGVLIGKNDAPVVDDAVPPAQCVGVMDGDTIKILWDGTKETVRILGIDTPETRAISRLEKQAKELNMTETELKKYGNIAKQTTQNWLLDQNVRLVFPSDEVKRDSFGRLLAYVEQQGVDIGERLLLGGLAQSAEWEHTRTASYRLFEEEAQRTAKGIWRNSKTSKKRK